MYFCLILFRNIGIEVFADKVVFAGIAYSPSTLNVITSWRPKRTFSGEVDGKLGIAVPFSCESLRKIFKKNVLKVRTITTTSSLHLEHPFVL